ncbi:MAG: transglutaminase domain-containing protein [Treponema sp.]|jgi:hypothetical protein|nr:transglutaminase domain-containing protein [Treponema sp.]
MKKPSVLLFCLRLFFYLSVAGLVLLHPGIIVSYDRTGLVQWFLIIPLEALIAFLPAPKGRLKNKLLLALLPLCLISVIAGGFSTTALLLFFSGLASFVLTLLLFHHPRWGRLSILEPFFLAWVCFQLLVFSRSGEEIAGVSLQLTQFILVWTAVVFLFHSAVVYFCLFRSSSGGAKREGLAFALAAAAILALVIFVLPPDFIRNTVLVNLLQDKVDRMTKPSEEDWGIPDTGGGRRRGRDVVPGDQNGRRPSLRSLSEGDWPGDDGRSGGRERQQFTVMVVASKHEPVYMGNSIRGRLDPVSGFLPGPEETLNRLPSQRLFVTWFDNEFIFDYGREENEVFSLSTLSQKYLPYRPLAVEPTVLSENSGPFRYIHRVISNIHTDDPLELVSVPGRELGPLEKSEFAPYLEITLDETDREIFRAHLARVTESWQTRRRFYLDDEDNEYMERILAILLGFSDYQYDVNNGQDYSISSLVEFIADTKDGHCVHFSNTAAILGRMAGIPSRVVTGFLVAGNMQTIAHLRGLAALRSRIPLLQEFAFEDLYLVTDAHAHSWTQFYVPDYGWLDFEATRFAIPPIGFGDGNLRDVVIPQLDRNQVFSRVRHFPWRAALRIFALLAALLLLGAYVIRYGREAALYFGTRRGGKEGSRSLYLLLLARLAADGKPIKPVSKTAPEYSKLFGDGNDAPFAAFAAIYTELRWRTFADKAEEEKRFLSLMEEYRKILTSFRRKGLIGFVIRIFSLRGLAYL